MTLLNLMMGFNPAARVAILMHARHKKWARRKVVVSERALHVDVQIRKKKFESLRHMPHMQVIQSETLPIFSNSHIVHYRRTRMVVA